LETVQEVKEEKASLAEQVENTMFAIESHEFIQVMNRYRPDVFSSIMLEATSCSIKLSKGALIRGYLHLTAAAFHLDSEPPPPDGTWNGSLHA
jgi:hypothetical protein